MRVRVHLDGPGHHGVVRHARTLARLLQGAGADVVSDGPAEVTHAQFTDALWGADVASAADGFGRWATGVPRPLVTTLHDLPGGDPDPTRDARRVAAYARVVAISDAVIVSSRHEAARAARLGAPGADVVELPLPEPPPRPQRPRPAREATSAASLGVVGFVYPGKGHLEVIEAAAATSRALRVVALGDVSPGHTGLVADLERRAAELGVGWELTGPLDDPAMAAAMGEVTVPVAPGAAPSASASLVAWIGHRRRPLTRAGDYADELAGRHPGVLWPYRDRAALRDAVISALDDPASTRLTCRPDWADVAAEHLAVYRSCAGRARAV